MSGTGARLRRLRQAAGFSLRGLAAAAGVPHNTIHRIEAGQAEPTARTCALLAVALAVSPAYLLGETDEPGEPPARARLAHCLQFLDEEAVDVLARVCRLIRR